MDIRSFFKKSQSPKKKAAAAATSNGENAGSEQQQQQSQQQPKISPKVVAAMPTTPTVIDLEDDVVETPAYAPKNETKRHRSVVIDSSDDEGEKGTSQSPGGGIRLTPAKRTGFSLDDMPSSQKKRSSASPAKGKKKTKKDAKPEAPKLPPAIQKRLDAAIAALPKEPGPALFSVRTASAEASAEANGGWGQAPDDNPPRRGSKAPPPAGAHPDAFAGMTFVVSGVLDSLRREEAEDLVKRHGGRVTKSVSGRTTFVIVGHGAGTSKVNTARDKGTRLVDEDGLFSLIQSTVDPDNAPQSIPPVQSDPSKPTPMDTDPPKASTPLQGGSGGRGGIKAPEKRKEPAVPTSGASGATPSSSCPPTASTGQLWVEKYRPQRMEDFVGNRQAVTTLATWLRNWHRVHVDGGSPVELQQRGKPLKLDRKAVLLAGPPGIGKTTSAVVLVRALGFEPMEVNASDARGKADSDRNKGIGGKLSNQIKEMVTSTRLGVSNGGACLDAAKRQPVLIMDECDGMSGGDRGGLPQIVECIKLSKIPVICICNDKYNQKMKTLRTTVVHELDFRKPTKVEIAKRMMHICRLEGLQTNQVTLETLAERSNGDLRVILGHLQNVRLTKTQLLFDDVKEAGAITKDADMSPFACAQALLSKDARSMTTNDQINLVFQDADFVPLLVQENYLNHIPDCGPLHVPRGQVNRLKFIAKASDAIADGDIVNNKLRGQGEWSLMPFAAVMGCVYPCLYMRGPRQAFGLFPGEPNYMQMTAWMGNNSKSTKMRRILGEVQSAMLASKNCRANAKEVGMSYLPLLRMLLSQPMLSKGKDGIDDVMATMDDYNISREQWDEVYALAEFKKSKSLPKPLCGEVKGQLKSAFTRQFNKASHPQRMAAEAVKLSGEKGKKGKGKKAAGGATATKKGKAKAKK